MGHPAIIHSRTVLDVADESPGEQGYYAERGGSTAQKDYDFLEQFYMRAQWLDDVWDFHSYYEFGLLVL